MNLRIFFTLILVFFSSVSYALPFTITPKLPLPTTIVSGNTITAYYTVMNNTQSSRSGNFVKYLPPNVTQVTSGGIYSDTCGNTFNLAANGSVGDSCTLQLNISGVVYPSNNSANNIFVCFPQGITCAGTNFSLNVSSPTAKVLTSISVTPAGSTIMLSNTKQFTATGTYSDNTTADITANVTWISSNTSVAAISTTGLVTPVSVGQSFIHAIFQGVTSNSATINIAAYAYIADSGSNQVSYCVINNDGTLSSCTSTGSGFNTPFNIALSPSKAYAYITNSGNNTVSYCAINNAGTLNNCTTTGSGFNNPYGIAINPTGTLAYIVNNNSNTVSYCTVNSDGHLSDCGIAGTSFNLPLSIAITPSGANAYIIDQGTGQILMCPINSNGKFNTCTNSISSANASGITFNATGTRAYFSGFGNTFLTCLISNTGSFTSCSGEGGGGLTNPHGAAVTDFYAYTPNSTTTSAGYCAINGDGTLNPFATTGGGLSTPFGIAI